MTRPRLGAIDVALTSVIGVGIAALAAQTKSFWGDEIRSLEFATLSVGRGLAELAADCHPPAYFLLLRLWVNVFGTSELALRLFQGLQGSALLLAALAAFRRLMPEWRFHPFWILLALASELWLCMPMLRYYALAAALALATTLVFIRWLERPSPGRALRLGALYALLLYTDYPASFVAVMHFVYLTAARRELLLRLSAIGAAAAVPFLPWLGITIRQIQSLQAVERVADLNASWVSVPVKIAYSAYAFVLGEMTYPFEPVAIAGVLLLLAAAIVAARELGARRSGPALAMLAAGLAGSCFTAVITSFIAKRMSFILTPSRTLYCLPIFYLAFGLAYAQLASRGAKLLLVAPFLAFALYGDANWLLSRHFLMPVYATPWKAIVASLRGESGGVVADQVSCFRYYRDRMPGDYPVILRAETPESLQAELVPLAAADGTVFVDSIELGRESTDSEVGNAVTEYLATHGTLESERKFLPIDPSYRAFKARISKRDTYDAKVTVRRYRLRLAGASTLPEPG